MGSRRASPPAVLRNSRDVQASPDVRARPVSSRPTRGRDAGGRVDWKARCSEESESCDHACGDRQHSLLRSPRRNVGDSDSSITGYTSMRERWGSRGSRVLGTAPTRARAALTLRVPARRHRCGEFLGAASSNRGSPHPTNRDANPEGTHRCDCRARGRHHPRSSRRRAPHSRSSRRSTARLRAWHVDAFSRGSPIPRLESKVRVPPHRSNGNAALQGRRDSSLQER